MKGKYKGPLYPSKADGKIPAFKSYEEEANFWDTHSFTEFEDQLEDVDIVFELDKPSCYQIRPISSSIRGDLPCR